MMMMIFLGVWLIPNTGHASVVGKKILLQIKADVKREFRAVKMFLNVQSNIEIKRLLG